MQGEFEKKVQEKMEELRLPPSAPVWNKIERELAPPRKRRRGLFWIPLTLLLLAGGWWWLQQQKPQATTANNRSATTQPPLSKRKEEISESQVEKKSPSTQPATTAPQDSITQKNLPFATAKPEKVRPNSGKEQTSPAEARNSWRNSTRQTARIQNTARPVARPKAGEAPWVGPATGKELAGTETGVGRRESNHRQPVSDEPLRLQKDKDALSLPVGDASTSSAVAQQAQNGTGTASPLVKDSLLTKSDTAKPGIATPAKWKKALVLRAGWSDPTNLTSSTGALRDNYSSQPLPGSSMNNASLMESPLSAGPTFTVGAVLARQLGKRWEVTIGLQYTFYSTRRQVGGFQAKDTSLSFAAKTISLEGYYRNGRQSRYATHYHLLELPLGIRFQPAADLPLTLAAGALYGRVLQSNALSYSRAGNFYFRNPASVARNHLAVFSSVTYRWLKGPQWSVEAGPFVQYQVTGLEVEQAAPTRLFSSGLKAALNF